MSFLKDQPTASGDSEKMVHSEEYLMGEVQRNKGYKVLPRTQQKLVQIRRLDNHFSSLVSHEAEAPLSGLRFVPEMLKPNERVEELTFSPEF